PPTKAEREGQQDAGGCQMMSDRDDYPFGDNVRNGKSSIRSEGYFIGIERFGPFYRVSSYRPECARPNRWFILSRSAAAYGNSTWRWMEDAIAKLIKIVGEGEAVTATALRCARCGRLDAFCPCHFLDGWVFRIDLNGKRTFVPPTPKEARE